MTANQIIFYLISAFVLGAGILSVTAEKIFRAAIWLLCSLIGIAGFYFWMDVQFIAAVQIVVYAGGIVVLIIFSIFLTQKSGEQMKKPSTGRMVAAVLAVVSGFLLAYSLIYQHGFPVKDQSGKSYNYDVNIIGTKMLSTAEDGFALPFEVVSILLLAAMIGCIVIAMKKSKEDLKSLESLKDLGFNLKTGESFEMTDLSNETTENISNNRS